MWSIKAGDESKMLAVDNTSVLFIWLPLTKGSSDNEDVSVSFQQLMLKGAALNEKA